MGTHVTIRSLGPHDSIEDLTALLHRAYAPLGKCGLNYTAVDQAPEYTAQKNALGECVVAVRGEVVVGTILIHGPALSSDCSWYRRAEVASAHRFAVEPVMQRSGIGLSLLRWAENHAKAKGYAELALDTAEPADHLVKFYKTNGYRFIEYVQWPGRHYRSVVLSKPLAP